MVMENFMEEAKIDRLVKDLCLCDAQTKVLLHGVNG